MKTNSTNSTHSRLLLILGITLLIALFSFDIQAQKLVSKKGSTTRAQKITTNAPEDFAAFEKKFFSNAQFQLKRIHPKFIGYDNSDMGESVEIRKKDWKASVTGITVSSYKGKVIDGYHYEEEISPSRICLTIYVPNTSFSTSYTWERVDGLWYLIGYQYS